MSNLEDLSSGKGRCQLCGREPGICGCTMVDWMKAIRDVSNAQYAADQAARTMPVDLNDHAQLLAHLNSAGHFESVHSGTSLEEMKEIHDDSHAEAPDEPHTTLGGSHFHHEWED